MTVPADVIGSTGHTYHFRKLIQERPYFGRVWLAILGSEQERYILKDIPEAIFSNFNENIRSRLPKNKYIRLPCDQIQDQRILVYRYLTDDFYSLAKKQADHQANKQILKATLRGLVALHSHDVVHLDVKPHNVLIDRLQVSGEFLITEVQLADLENAAYLPKGRCIKGMLPGNDSWRSPEGHLRGELNKPSDIFSFGIMCIYAMLGRVVFEVDEDFKKHEMQGAIPYLIHLQRQVCYFGDKEGLNGLMNHIGDDEMHCQALKMLWDERNEEYLGYLPFDNWPEVDDKDFKDLIRCMMSLDPAKRITAVKALEHPWFAGI